MIDAKVIEHRPKRTLRSATHFQEKAVLLVLFRKASVVEKFHTIRDCEQNNTAFRTFLEHKKAHDTPVVILEKDKRT